MVVLRGVRFPFLSGCLGRSRSEKVLGQNSDGDKESFGDKTLPVCLRTAHPAAPKLEVKPGTRPGAAEASLSKRLGIFSIRDVDIWGGAINVFSLSLAFLSTTSPWLSPVIWLVAVWALKLGCLVR